MGADEELRRLSGALGSQLDAQEAALSDGSWRRSRVEAVASQIAALPKEEASSTTADRRKRSSPSSHHTSPCSLVTNFLFASPRASGSDTVLIRSVFWICAVQLPVQRSRLS